MTTTDLDQVRANHKVVPVSKEDEGRSWSKISNGVFGFTYTPASRDGGIFIKQPRDSYEMHKLADGSLHILGYTKPEHAKLIAQKDAVEVELYPQPREGYGELVIVPHARISSAKELNRDDFNKLRAVLKAI